MGKLKDNVGAFVLANKIRSLVSDFNKDFLKFMKDQPFDTKVKMYQLCIRYMKESIEKRFK